jgi:UDP-N-acetylmuramoyl-tripeptide--D-alanyl-D-alanine ligase
MTSPTSTMSAGWRSEELAHAVAGELLAPGTGHPLDRAVADTRHLRQGGVFLALQGRRMHGIEAWQHAVQAGAGAILVGSDAPPERVQEVVSQLSSEVALIQCDVPSLEMVGIVARAWRRRCDFTVIGITGSSGKTSTKELLREVLSDSVRVAASHANHNNELGVPLTLLGADPQTDVVICEMGMRGLGQITYLCDIAEPDIGIITTIGTAHLELLGSVANIAQAKSEIIAGVRGGIAIIPASNPDLLMRSGGDPGTVLTFSGPETAVEGSDIAVLDVTRTRHGIAGVLEHRDMGKAPFEVPFHGVHNAGNLAAACCAMLAAGCSWEQVMLAVRRPLHAWNHVTSGRGERIVLAELGVVINDAYNANPESMRAALDELAAVNTSGARVAVLGFMAELGPDAASMHAQVATHAASLPIDRLVVLNTMPEVMAMAEAWNELRSDPAVLVSGVQSLIDEIADWAPGPDGAVLIKASNSVGLGRAVEVLVERYGAHQDARKGDQS